MGWGEGEKGRKEKGDRKEIEGMSTYRYFWGTKSEYFLSSE